MRGCRRCRLRVRDDGLRLGPGVVGRRLGDGSRHRLRHGSCRCVGGDLRGLRRPRNVVEFELGLRAVRTIRIGGLVALGRVAGLVIAVAIERVLRVERIHAVRTRATTATATAAAAATAGTVLALARIGGIRRFHLFDRRGGGIGFHRGRAHRLDRVDRALKLGGGNGRTRRGADQCLVGLRCRYRLCLARRRGGVTRRLRGGCGRGGCAVARLATPGAFATSRLWLRGRLRRRGIRLHTLGLRLARLVLTLLRRLGLAALCLLRVLRARLGGLRTRLATRIAILAAATASALVATLATTIATRLRRPRRDRGGRRRLPAEEAQDALDHAHRMRRRRDRRGRGRNRRHRCRLARLAQRRRLRGLDVGDRGRRRNVEVRLGQRMRRQLARRAALVARTARFLAKLVLADARDLEVRRLELVVGDDDDGRIVALLDLGQRAALLVEQVVGDLGRGLHQHLSGVVLHRMLFGQAQYRKRKRFDAAHAPMALAARADDLARFAQRRTQALAAQFEQAEARDAADLHARAVVAQGVGQPVLDLALVLGGRHVDEVDDHQATEVAQAHLPRDFLGRLEVRVERGLLDVAALGGARRVHVDRGQRLGLVDHQRAAGGQLHRALVGRLDLRLDLVAIEQRNVIGVVLELADVVRHDLLHELARLRIHLGRVDEHFADVRAHVVAQRADDQARFLVDQEGRRLRKRGVADGAPDLQQVVEVPLQLFGIAAHAGGADDHPHVVGDVQRIHRLLELGAVVALDAARHATRRRRVRHQHHVAAGQRDERGERSALVAALFLVDLHDDFLALLEEFLQPGLVGVDARLEVVAGNFLERQEAVAIAAVLDERRLQRGLEPRDPALVDVRLLLFLGRLFDVDVVQVLAVDDRDAQFFRLRRIDEHALHCSSVLARIRATAPWRRLWARASVARVARARAPIQRCTPRRAAGALVRETRCETLGPAAASVERRRRTGRMSSHDGVTRRARAGFAGARC